MDTHSVFCLCVPQQFPYGINSRTLFSSILYSTQRGAAQNSSVGNQYGMQKFTNCWLIIKWCVELVFNTVIKIAFFGYLLVFFGTGLLPVSDKFRRKEEKKLGFRRNNSVKLRNFGTEYCYYLLVASS